MFSNFDYLDFNNWGEESGLIDWSIPIMGEGSADSIFFPDLFSEAPLTDVALQTSSKVEKAAKTLSASNIPSIPAATLEDFSHDLPTANRVVKIQMPPPPVNFIEPSTDSISDRPKERSSKEDLLDNLVLDHPPTLLPSMEVNTVKSLPVSLNSRLIPLEKLRVAISGKGWLKTEEIEALLGVKDHRKVYDHLMKYANSGSICHRLNGRLHLFGYGDNLQDKDNKANQADPKLIMMREHMKGRGWVDIETLADYFGDSLIVMQRFLAKQREASRIISKKINNKWHFYFGDEKDAGQAKVETSRKRSNSNKTKNTRPKKRAREEETLPQIAQIVNVQNIIYNNIQLTNVLHASPPPYMSGSFYMPPNAPPNLNSIQQGTMGLPQNFSVDEKPNG